MSAPGSVAKHQLTVQRSQGQRRDRSEISPPRPRPELVEGRASSTGTPPTIARAPLSRRSFLRYTAITTGLATVARLRAVPAAATTGGEQLRVFSGSQADVLTAIVARMVDSGDSSMPAVSDTRAIEIIDHTLTFVDEAVQTQLQWLLTLFQYGPPIFQLRLATFTSMSPEDQDDYIRGWASSRFETRRLAFRALKNLSMLGYYADDATWPGIHYAGPWVPRPRQLPPESNT